MKDNNWTVEQTVELFSLCESAKKQGKSLQTAFFAMSEKTGRSLNSVRNFYYGQSKTFELVPEIAKKLGIAQSLVKRDRFVPFTDDEVRELIEEVLVAKGGGMSVRSAIRRKANGDDRLALRLQNKYRSALRSHRDTVEEVMASLSARGIEYADPYAGRRDNFERLTEYIAGLDSKRVDKLLSALRKR